MGSQRAPFSSVQLVRQTFTKYQVIIRASAKKQGNRSRNRNVPFSALQVLTGGGEQVDGRHRRQVCTWFNGSLGKRVPDPIKGFRENNRILDRVLGMQGMKKFLGIKWKREMQTVVWSAFVSRGQKACAWENHSFLLPGRQMGAWGLCQENPSCIWRQGPGDKGFGTILCSMWMLSCKSQEVFKCFK